MRVVLVSQGGTGYVKQELGLTSEDLQVLLGNPQINYSFCQQNTELHQKRQIPFLGAPNVNRSFLITHPAWLAVVLAGGRNFKQTRLGQLGRAMMGKAGSWYLVELVDPMPVEPEVMYVCERDLEAMDMPGKPEDCDLLLTDFIDYGDLNNG